MEKNLENLVQACDLIDEYNQVDVPGLPKVIGLVLLTYDGEIIQMVPRRVADDITQQEVTKELMNSCECNCNCDEDLEEVVKEIISGVEIIKPKEDEKE